jgi:serine/threonine-protein kinase RsbW
MVDVGIAIDRPRLELRLRSEKDNLPIVRQALRAIGERLGAVDGVLQDAELALTEASANAIRHAYGNGDGIFEVTIEARAAELLAIVRDRGRGMRGHWRDGARRGGDSGLGLTVIESVAQDVQIRSERGAGTEVAMTLPGPDLPEPPASDDDTTAERVVRRLVALACAQADLPPASVTEALLAAELVTRHAADHIVGDALRAKIDRRPGRVELRIGPLDEGGAAAILRAADVPALGSVVERFADRVWTVAGTPGQAGAGEQLALRFLA